MFFNSLFYSINTYKDCQKPNQAFKSMAFGFCLFWVMVFSGSWAGWSRVQAGMVITRSCCYKNITITYIRAWDIVPTALALNSIVVLKVDQHQKYFLSRYYTKVKCPRTGEMPPYFPS
jgi:hypothetical protein